MKWYEMYDRHFIDWEVKGHGKTYSVDLFRLCRILLKVPIKPKQGPLFDKVARILRHHDEERIRQYVAVMCSVRGQGRTDEIIDKCKLLMIREEEAEEKEPKGDKVVTGKQMGFDF